VNEQGPKLNRPLLWQITADTLSIPSTNTLCSFAVGEKQNWCNLAKSEQVTSVGIGGCAPGFELIVRRIAMLGYRKRRLSAGCEDSAEQIKLLADKKTALPQ
jgi:hypothetical protein